MHVQVNTDHNIEGHEALAGQVRGIVASVLARFSAPITRVEVHLRNESSPKGGRGAMRCMLEARLKSRQPVAVTHQAATLEEALQGASDKMARLIESTMERHRDQRNRRTDPLLPEEKATQHS